MKKLEEEEMLKKARELHILQREQAKNRPTD